MKYRYRLVGSCCSKCGRKYFPRRLVCRECNGRDLVEWKMPERGRLITYTIVRSPPKGYEKDAPYIVGIVELEPGLRVISQIVDCPFEEAKIGMSLQMAFRKIRENGVDGIIEYGFKFRPPLS